MNAVALWLFSTLLSLVVGGVVGFAFIWIWFFVGVFFLGYGDSGPSWVNVVNDIVFIVGIVLSLVGGQWIFFKKVRRQTGTAASAPPQ